jgi:hypothetical protein
MMRKRNIISILLLLFFAAYSFAQTDSIRLKDSSRVNTSLFTSYQLKCPVVFTHDRFNYFNHRFNNYETKGSTFNYDPYYFVSPCITFSDGYSQFKIQNNYYNKYSPSYSFQYRNSVLLVDPSNPWNTNKPGEALILGSANYLFSKIFSGH